jgi:hypothetical protein
MEERPGCVKSLRNVGLLHHSTRAQTVPPAFSAKSLHDRLNCQALGSAAGSHPQPLAPAAFASASRTQHAFASPGAGPPQHGLVFALVPVSLSVVAVFDISPPHSGEHSLLTRQG